MWLTGCKSPTNECGKRVFEVVTESDSVQFYTRLILFDIIAPDKTCCQHNNLTISIWRAPIALIRTVGHEMNFTYQANLLSQTFVDFSWK